MVAFPFSEMCLYGDTHVSSLTAIQIENKSSNLHYESLFTLMEDPKVISFEHDLWNYIFIQFGKFIPQMMIVKDKVNWEIS